MSFLGCWHVKEVSCDNCRIDRNSWVQGQQESRSERLARLEDLAKAFEERSEEDTRRMRESFQERLRQLESDSKVDDKAAQQIQKELEEQSRRLDALEKVIIGWIGSTCFKQAQTR